MCQSDGKIILCLRHHRNFLLTFFVCVCESSSKGKRLCEQQYNHEKKISIISIFIQVACHFYFTFLWDACSNEDLFKILIWFRIKTFRKGAFP